MKSIAGSKLVIGCWETTLTGCYTGEVIGEQRELHDWGVCIVIRLTPSMPRGTTFGKAPIPEEMLGYLILSARHEGFDVAEFFRSERDEWMVVYASSAIIPDALTAPRIGFQHMDGFTWAMIVRDEETAKKYNMFER